MRDTHDNWQKILAQGFSSSAELLSFLKLPLEKSPHLAEAQFKTRVPLGFAMRMQSGVRDDPLLKQVLAVDTELTQAVGFNADPLDEANFNPIPGLIHKYYGRVLLTVMGACAVNCRYCFRRHFNYKANNPQKDDWHGVVEYIANNPSINEVILSGGDPLLAKDQRLRTLFDALKPISHVKTIRIHSRIPVVLPERIDADFMSLLSSLPWKMMVVLHSNHAQELDASVALACARLKDSGCLLLNQSVLLRGVNDSSDILAQLSWRLLDCHVLPYYLHLLDHVQGAEHFNIPRHEAIKIFKKLQTQLPGYLVPRLACEEAGKPHKTLVGYASE